MMDTPIKTETDFQAAQQHKDDSYMLKVNDIDVIIRFTGSDSLSTRLASAFSAMLK